VNLRCYLLSFLRIHRPGCELCKARHTCGNQIRKRLEELRVPAQPHWVNSEDNGEVAEVFDSEPVEVVANDTHFVQGAAASRRR
jgi:hypothetical protein